MLSIRAASASRLSSSSTNWSPDMFWSRELAPSGSRLLSVMSTMGMRAKSGNWRRYRAMMRPCRDLMRSGDCKDGSSDKESSSSGGRASKRISMRMASIFRFCRFDRWSASIASCAFRARRKGHDSRALHAKHEICRSQSVAHVNRRIKETLAWSRSMSMRWSSTTRTWSFSGDGESWGEDWMGKAELCSVFLDIFEPNPKKSKADSSRFGISSTIEIRLHSVSKSSTAATISWSCWISSFVSDFPVLSRTTISSRFVSNFAHRASTRSSLSSSMGSQSGSWRSLKPRIEAVLHIPVPESKSRRART